MRKPFVVVSGLPGSGKTTLARRLAPAIDLPLIDKDDILDRLFESKGIGDAAWRRALSRESDAILQRDAMATDGAVLVSLWRVDGMAAGSGSPTDWLRSSSYRVVNVHAVCEPELAASRFFQRRRHAGHLDAESSHDEVLRSLQTLARLGPLDIGQRIDVDTSHDVNVDAVARMVGAALRRL